MKILFVNLSAVQFTVATPEHSPLGGTESCIAYLSRQLAHNGHNVSLVSNQPAGTPDNLMGVQHAQLSLMRHPEFFASQNFEVIIICNAASLCPIVKALSPHSLLLFWDHIPPDQPAIHDLGRNDVLTAIDSIVYVSEWQKTETQLHFKFEKEAAVIGNGLTPSFENLFSSPAEIINAKENRAAYTTIPYRGLGILLKAMAGFEADMKLDLFSSMQVYQMPDDEYEDLYREAAQDPRIHSYGSVSQIALAHHLKKTAFLTYPCICAETFCISVLEALAAGMKVITTDLGALPSTTMGYGDLIPVTSNDSKDLVNDFRKALTRNVQAFLNDSILWAEERYEQIKVVNTTCTWTARTVAWQKFLHGLLQKEN